MKETLDSYPFLVVSYAIPIRTSGTSVVIRNFLENFRRDEIVLMGRPVRENNRIENYILNYPTYMIPVPPVGSRGERVWRILATLLGVFVGLWIIRKHNVKAIVAYYVDDGALLTGYLLHKITKLPYYPYFCDLYAEILTNKWDSFLAKWLQPKVFKSARTIFVLTEEMQNYYRQKYNLNTVVLPHCNNIQPLRISSVTKTQPIRIGYLGSIFVDRIPSLKQLNQSVGERSDFEIVYFTSHNKSFLAQHGLLSSNVKIVFVQDQSKLLLALQKCDILFLPAMPDTNFPGREPQLLTGFPTKAIEYLLCQKSILVHSRRDYFTAKFFEKYQCGYVLDGGADSLLAALIELSSNVSLRQRLQKNTVNALAYFDGTKVANTFRENICQ